jgi:hypothetical protein
VPERVAQAVADQHLVRDGLAQRTDELRLVKRNHRREQMMVDGAPSLRGGTDDGAAVVGKPLHPRQQRVAQSGGQRLVDAGSQELLGKEWVALSAPVQGLDQLRGRASAGDPEDLLAYLIGVQRRHSTRRARPLRSISESRSRVGCCGDSSSLRAVTTVTRRSDR